MDGAGQSRRRCCFWNPSLRYSIRKQLDFTPALVVADMAYINLAMQRRLREELHVGVVTRLPPNYDLPREIEPALLMRCRQGQKLQWLGLRENEQLHWFGVAEEGEPLQVCCAAGQRSQCPQEFSFAPSQHEIALGTIPLSTKTAQRLLNQARTWIEATQSYEKMQLGLERMFLNSLRLASVMSQLADTVMLLRAQALLREPKEPHLLALPTLLATEFLASDWKKWKICKKHPIFP